LANISGLLAWWRYTCKDKNNSEFDLDDLKDREWLGTRGYVTESKDEQGDEDSREDVFDHLHKFDLRKKLNKSGSSSIKGLWPEIRRLILQGAFPNGD